MCCDISGDLAGILFHTGASDRRNMKLAIKEEKLPMMKQLKACCVKRLLVDHYLIFSAVPVWRSGKERFHELLLPLDV